MVSVIYLPTMPLLFHMPAWLSMGLTIAGLGLSAVLSGWLPKHPRIQKYVTALALAFVLAGGIAVATRPDVVRYAVMMECVCYWGWESWCCYF